MSQNNFYNKEEQETIAKAVKDLKKHEPGFKIHVSEVGLDPRQNGYACFKATLTDWQGKFLAEDFGLEYKDPDDPLDFTFVGRAVTKAKRRAINWLLMQYEERDNVHDDVDLDKVLILTRRKIERLLSQGKKEEYIRKNVINKIENQKIKNDADHYLTEQIAKL